MLEDDNKFLSTTVFIFVVVGFGIGLTGFIGLNAIQDPGLIENQEEMSVTALTMMMILMALLLGPIIAAITGFLSGFRSENSGKAMTLSMFGSVLGFFLMVILALALSSNALPENPLYLAIFEETLNANIASILIQASLPTGIVGLLSAYIGFRFENADS